VVALKKEKDQSSLKRLKKIKNELGNLQEQKKELEIHWKMEKDLIQSIRETKTEIDQSRNDMEKAERQGNLNIVAEIKYGKIPELENKLRQTNEKLAEIQKDKKMLKEEVDDEDIAEIVSRWTSIPVSKMLEGELDKLLSMPEKLAQRVVGQTEAINAVANAIRRSRAGLSDENKPIGSFIFLGPTGVGKTELARALAEFLFDNEDAMIRIDMSEYMERHTVSRLIGAPPGYVGYDEGGQLSEAVRRKPYSVVLLDEIEKAHPEVFNILLQILDDGRLTDNKGHVVNFKNTIIIMTSNIGAHEILEKSQQLNDENHEMVYNEMRTQILSLLRSQLKPEFLNRIEEIIVFHSLNKMHIKMIVDIQLRKIQEQLKNQDIVINISDEAKSHLAELGYDAAFGARPLRRVIQKEILDRLAIEILGGKIGKGDTLFVDYQDDKINFHASHQNSGEKGTSGKSEKKEFNETISE
jgi:ATP-dependent Clp protease ATP-binding subunit ClpB